MTSRRSRTRRHLDLEDRFDVPLSRRGWIEGRTMFEPGRFDRMRRTSGGVAALGGGFAFAYREFGSRVGSFAVDWTGHPTTFDRRGREVSQHVEATPLVHVDPATDAVGFGAWPTRFPNGADFWLVGTIASRPTTDYEVRYAAGFTGARLAGAPAEVRLDTDGTHALLFLDGVAQPLRRFDRRWQKLVGPVVTRVPIPRELRRSTLHGFALDSHLARNRSTPAITAFRASWPEPAPRRGPPRR